jgi:CRP-like cAMP-binding protein
MTPFDQFLVSLRAGGTGQTPGTHLRAEEIERLRANSYERRLAMGEHFVRAGETCDTFAWVASGLFRFYYCGDDGHEYTSYFADAGDYVPSYAMVATRAESRFHVEALENSTLLAFPFSILDDLQQQSVVVGAIVRHFLVQALVGKELREASLILDDGEARYREFLASYPTLENRVLLRHVASYLALSPVSLSRIRRRMADT